MFFSCGVESFNVSFQHVIVWSVTSQLHQSSFFFDKKKTRPFSSKVKFATDSSLDDENAVPENDDQEGKTDIEKELERLQYTLITIEALEERNKAQLESFVNEEDQWNSLEDFERELLGSKEEILERTNKMVEKMTRLWMDAKSVED